MDIQQIVQDYGYWAVFLGSLVEGESVILTAGAMAYKGYLSLFWIIFISFLGTLFADQFLYFVGRKHGRRALEKWPKLKPRAEKASYFLHKYDAFFIMGFRFVYGIRTISPVIIGICGVSPRRFCILNILSALVWAVISCSAGYCIGYGVSKIWPLVEEYVSLKVMVIGAIVIVISLGVWVYRWRKSKASTPPKSPVSSGFMRESSSFLFKRASL